MSIHLKLMAQANAIVANTIRNALPTMDTEGNVKLNGDQLMAIMSNTGLVANSILSLQAEGPAEQLEEAAHIQTQDSHATAAHDQPVRQDVAVMQALDAGVNIPGSEDMQRAIQAAALINQAARGPAAQPAPLAPLTLQQRIAKEQLDQEGQNQTQVVTGSTSTTPATSAKPVSAANKERNDQIQQRLRQSLNKDAGAPATQIKPRPAVAVEASPEQPPRPVVKPMARANTVNMAARQAEIEAAQAATALANQVHRTEVPAEVLSRAPLGKIGPGARSDGYLPAVGTSRDVTTANPNPQGMNSIIPESEMLAGANATDAYDPIPGVNVNVPSPYIRLTDPEYSEFSKMFEASAFTPDCKGFVGITNPAFPWNRELELPKVAGPELVRLAQGFYGHNVHNGGPNYVLIRLPRNIIIWNFNHTPGNCRIFYIGRSNITGIWYTPEAMDRLELFTTVAELAEKRVQLAHEMAGTVYKKAGNILL